jgi:hypothetical protein
VAETVLEQVVEMIPAVFASALQLEEYLQSSFTNTVVIQRACYDTC